MVGEDIADGGGGGGREDACNGELFTVGTGLGCRGYERLFLGGNLQIVGRLTRKGGCQE